MNAKRYSKTYLQSRRYTILGWVICLVAALFYCYEYLLRIEPSVMVPQLRHAFHLDASSLGVLLAMYYIAYTPLQAVVGITTDYFGPKKVLIAAIASCALGVFLFGLTNDYWVASIGRFFVGLGSAFAFVGVLKLAALWLSRSSFAMFVGFTTALGMVGAMAGDVGMSYTVKEFGWHRVIWISAIAGAVLLPIFAMIVSERANKLIPKHTLKVLVHNLWTLVKDKHMWYAGLTGCFFVYLVGSVC